MQYKVEHYCAEYIACSSFHGVSLSPSVRVKMHLATFYFHRIYEGHASPPIPTSMIEHSLRPCAGEHLPEMLEPRQINTWIRTVTAYKVEWNDNTECKLYSGTCIKSFTKIIITCTVYGVVYI